MEPEAAPAPGSRDWWARQAAPTTGRGRPPIAIERIIEAGLEVLDSADGSEYSIRSVAALLGSSTATLYRRVSGRPGLDALIVDHVLGEALSESSASPGMNWKAASIESSNAVFEVLARHPRVVPLLAAQVPQGPNSETLREQFLSRLLAEGFERELAARTYTTVAHFMIGFSLQLSFDSSPDGEVSRSPQLVGRPPATASVAEHLDVGLREEFLFGLTMLLDGIDSSRSRSRPRS